MVTYRVETWNAAGELLRDFEVEVAEEDGAAFILHHALHVDGVVCARVSDLAGELVDQRCDDDASFELVLR